MKYLIRDGDGKYPPLFDAILADASITAVLSGATATRPNAELTIGLPTIRMPRMNPVIKRWVQSCRLELLDRTSIFNQVHLLRPAEV